MKKSFLISTLLCISISFSAQSVELIKDIFKGSENSFTFEEDSVLVHNDILYFVAADSAHGQELWKFDGTEASLVKDIMPGIKGSECRNLYVCNNKILFTANDSVHGTEWWETDGTEQGTNFVADIFPGVNDGVYNGGMSAYRCFKVYKNKIFFNGQNDTDNHELWCTDGTSAGTMLIKNIATDYSFNMESFPNDFEIVNDTLYISTNSYGIWKTAGETANTSLVESIMFPSNLCAMENYLLFIKQDELWRSNGTSATTYSLGNIGNPNSINWFGDRIIRLGDKAYFAGYDSIHGSELWVTDGTSAGTKIVKDAWPGVDGYSPQNMIVYKNKIYYKGDDGVNEIELWCSDGTEAGTYMVVNIGNNDAGFYLPSSIYTDGNLIYMNAGAAFQSELWVTDGTENGTYRININLDGQSSPRSFKTYKNKLFCFAKTDELGYEPYYIDVSKSTSVIHPEFKMSIWPNPTTDFINILPKIKGEYELKIIDLNGNLLINQDFIDSTSLNIQSLPKASYIICVQNKKNKEKAYSKLLKK